MVGINVMTIRGISIGIVKRSGKFRVSLAVLDCLKSNLSLFREVL